MHRLAGKAWQDHEGLTGISIIGKPVAFIKKAPFFIFIYSAKALCGKLATVAQISFFTNGGYLKEKFVAVSPFPYLSPGMVSEHILFIPEKEYQTVY